MGTRTPCSLEASMQALWCGRRTCWRASNRTGIHSSRVVQLSSSRVMRDSINSPGPPERSSSRISRGQTNPEWSKTCPHHGREGLKRCAHEADLKSNLSDTDRTVQAMCLDACLLVIDALTLWKRRLAAVAKDGPDARSDGTWGPQT